MTTTAARALDARGLSPGYQLDDAIRAWKRGGHRPGVLAIVDPDGVPDIVRRALLRVGIRVEAYRDPLRALPDLAYAGPRAVVLSASAVARGRPDLVLRLRRDYGLNVLLALGHGDVERATPAILAGAAPVLDLPLRPAALLHHLDRAWIDPPLAPRIIAVGGLELDEARTSAHLFGRALTLTGAEFELLWRIVEHDGRPVRRQDLWSLWPWADDQNGALVQAMIRLRRKLDHSGLGGLIRTVRGVGYSLDVRPTATSE